MDRADLALQRLGYVPGDHFGFLIGKQIKRLAALEPQRQTVQHDDLDRAQIGDAALAPSRLDNNVRKERRIRRGDLEGFDSRGGGLGLHDRPACRCGARGHPPGTGWAQGLFGVWFD